MLGVHPHGCGQCLACRINRRRIWTTRLMLESNAHEDKTFATLTYKDMPKHGSLDREDLRKFLKNLRYKIWPKKIRYYGVGEYGDDTWRPHYHVILYGYPNCLFGRTDKCRKYLKRPCTNCKVVEDVWKKGFVFLGDCSTQSVQYVAGYVTKFSGKKNCSVRDKRIPEFSMMSLKPGIGVNAMDSMSAVVKNALDRRLMDEIPTAIQVGNKMWPLGRYLTGKLRDGAKGVDRKTESFAEKVDREQLEEKEKNKKTLGLGAEMSVMLRKYIKRKGWPKPDKEANLVVKLFEQQIRSLNKREEIYKSRRIL